MTVPDSGSAAVRILVCDDHVVVRAGLLALLDSAPGIEVAGEAAPGRRPWRWPPGCGRTWC
ncbi:hypothetical protein SGRIM128S_03586 [Streptomyces griseomycini]